MGRYYNFFSISEKFTSSLSNEIKKRNLYDDRIFKNWKYIVDDFADKVSPYKITYYGIDKNNVKQKILYLSTEDRMFATEFLFYKKQLLEKLNLYFGEDKSKFIDLKIKVIS